MTREIKFRGLRTDSKGWVYGVFAKTENSYFIMPNPYFGTRELGEEDEFGNEIISNEIALGGFINIIPESIGQFTGLKDKNGVDIYEGDILKRTITFAGKSRVHLESVIFDESSFCSINVDDVNDTPMYLGNFKGHTIEIIGNIHEIKSNERK